ncbi:MAG: hypothetical protein GPJ52_00120 [Candidatus Heimdallarchaeota archaeon]|nr:hypothetical protein [Candidatus Heimdallarchaeota archaeon]
MSQPSSFPEFSYPDFREYPPALLSSSEIAFVRELLSGSPLPLFSGEQFAQLLLRHFPDLVGNVAPYSLRRNLLSGESYAHREYHSKDGDKTGELFLFRKGLVRAYPMPVPRTRFAYFYGYPREHYRLVKSNFRSKFPPHNAFAGWCRRAFTVGLAGSVLEDVTDRFRIVPHWDGSGEFVADFVYRTRLPDRDGSLVHWFEVHTGSEGYGEIIFLKRLLTMEQFLADRENNFFVVLVPFASDVVKGEAAIRKYNQQKTTTHQPVLTLQKSRILHYKQISSLRGEVGSFEHRTR